jgi:hypothetical protein
MTWIRWISPLLLALVITSTALAGSVPSGSPPDPGVPVYPGSPINKTDYSAFQAAIPAGLTAQADMYGYTLDDTVPPAWMDLTASGTEVLFSTPNEDDEAVGPFSLGFDFPFYENIYSEVYLSTNGLITFGDGSDLYDNQPSPRDTDPNNYITAFWDDLILSVDNNGQKVSQVFYTTGSGVNGKYFAIEWFQISRLGSQDKLTFEVVLYQTGDIIFQYNELNGILNQATVGIEDEHGVDGLLYLHNAPGLSVTKAVKFIRPATPDWRVKVYPVYRSGFDINNQISLDFTVRNTSNKTDTDVYDLVIGGVPAGWQLTWLSADGKTPLKDTDEDGVIDTGSLQPGADFKVVLKVVAPETAQAGDYIQPVITATSSRLPSKQAAVHMQIALPVPFAQASLDILAGPNLRLIWKHNLYGTNLNQGQQFTGSNLSVIAMPDKRYFYTWEHNLNIEGKSYANLEYMILNRFGVVLKNVSTLTDNNQATNGTEDRFLSLASTQSGRIGTIWVRTQRRDSDQKINQNMYFALLDSMGKMIVNPINLTQNDQWRGQEDYDVPVYIAPRIAVTADSRFLLAWGDERNHPEGSSADLFYAVFDVNGIPVAPVTPLTNSVGGEMRYSTPALVALPGNNVLMAYVVLNPGDPEDPTDDVSQAAYLALDSAGSLVKTETVITGSTGATPDGYLLSDASSVVLGWSVVSSAEVQYMLVDATSLEIIGGLVKMATPKGRIPSAISVTGDDQGHAVLTWGDAEQSDYLCYALVNTGGSTVTPPMVYTYGSGSNPLINTNSYGLGNAPYDGSWQVQLPLVRR